MKEKYKKFLVGVSVNWIGKLGAILTTSSFVTFFILEIPRLLGVLTNAYMGLITYLLLPTLFIAGLILMPYGWYKYHKETGISLNELVEKRFGKDALEENKTGAAFYRTILIFTIINILFLSIASFRTMKFMDGSEFCGTACHTVMNPEWMAYQESPHANVQCVSCHVGEGVGALVASKLNGAWQMVSATFDLYEKPIPTPVHNLRPARETCEKCHWPDKFYGSRLKSIVKYKKDEKNTPLYTTLNLKIDSGDKVGHSGIHWHISKDIKVTYSSIDDKRETIEWVKVFDDNGETKVYKNTRLDVNQLSDENLRVMDCIDCHNRATHIYELPEEAIDKRIRSSAISRNLPFIKKEALDAINTTLGDKDLAKEKIRLHIERFYQKNYPDLSKSKSDEIEKAIVSLQKAYDKNIHPNMNIFWGAYKNNIGHKNGEGCFRCHNENMKTDEGEVIRYDCTLCHNILSYDSPTPFEFLKPIKNIKEANPMHKYLQDDFLTNYK